MVETRARADIRDLKAYIAKDSPYYARRFTERIFASVENLEIFPKMGRPVPEAEGREDVRELIYNDGAVAPATLEVVRDNGRILRVLVAWCEKTEGGDPPTRVWGCYSCFYVFGSSLNFRGI